MRCNEVRQYLPDHLEDALPAEQAQQVEQHLHECVACTQERRMLERVPTLLQQWSPPVPSEKMWTGIERRIQTSQRVRRSRLVAWRPPLVAATLTATAIALIAYFLWNRLEPTYPPLVGSYENYWQAHYEWARHGGTTELYSYLEGR